jgi:hypothetical protein
MRLKLLAAFASLVLAPLPMAAQSGPFAQVPAEYRGEWVAASAACTAPVRVRVEATAITVINGTDKESLGGLEMAGPGYWGPDYKGIMALAITEFSGDQPLTASFNYGEKKGVAIVEFAMAGPDRPGNAVLNKMNAYFRKLNLAKRFPLHQVPLKKCPAAAR